MILYNDVINNVYKKLNDKQKWIEENDMYLGNGLKKQLIYYYLENDKEKIFKNINKDSFKHEIFSKNKTNTKDKPEEKSILDQIYEKLKEDKYEELIKKKLEIGQNTDNILNYLAKNYLTIHYLILQRISWSLLYHLKLNKTYLSVYTHPKEIYPLLGMVGNQIGINYSNLLRLEYNIDNVYLSLICKNTKMKNHPIHLELKFLPVNTKVIPIYLNDKLDNENIENINKNRTIIYSGKYINKEDNKIQIKDRYINSYVLELYNKLNNTDKENKYFKVKINENEYKVIDIKLVNDSEEVKYLELKLDSGIDSSIDSTDSTLDLIYIGILPLNLLINHIYFINNLSHHQKVLYNKYDEEGGNNYDKKLTEKYMVYNDYIGKIDKGSNNTITLYDYLDKDKKYRFKLPKQMSILDNDYYVRIRIINDPDREFKQMEDKKIEDTSDNLTLYHKIMIYLCSYKNLPAKYTNERKILEKLEGEPNILRPKIIKKLPENAKQYYENNDNILPKKEYNY